jgi:hypothetical protein
MVFVSDTCLIQYQKQQWMIIMLTFQSKQTHPIIVLRESSETHSVF